MSIWLLSLTSQAPQDFAWFSSSNIRVLNDRTLYVGSYKDFVYCNLYSCMIGYIRRPPDSGVFLANQRVWVDLVKHADLFAFEHVKM